MTNCFGDTVQLARRPIELGPAGTTFAPDDGIPVHGPRNKLEIFLPSGYVGKPKKLPDVISAWQRNAVTVYGPDDQPLTLRAALVFSDGQRRDIGLVGYESGVDGFSAVLGESVSRTPDARAQSLTLTSNRPVRVLRIRWWSGQPRCFPCL